MSQHMTTDNSLFEPFPAPRVWGLGWEGDACAGQPHQHSTLDTWAEVPGRIISIISDIPRPLAAQADGC